jgi:glucosamine kinase
MQRVVLAGILTLKQPLFVGVDGGATKVCVRLEDEAGQLIGQTVSGPANIRLSVTQAWQSIETALQAILHHAGLSAAKKSYLFHAGMGLAGCELESAYQAFLNYPHSFATLVVSSDAHTACLGAHGGENGAIIIAGTGTTGFQILNGQTTRVSGWGFPHDDEGGGAWLGLQVVMLTLQWLDGRLPHSNLVQAVYERFTENQSLLVEWAHHANSTAFAELAPLVIHQAAAGDKMAVDLLQQAAHAIDRIGAALDQTLPCSLVGGVATFIEPYLSRALRARLRPCQQTPEVGAVTLVRHRSMHGSQA